MNIFILDSDPVVAAAFHCDKHVVKMPLEIAQMLCTARNILGEQSPYKSTHVNHPCTIWTRSSLDNWRWAHKQALALEDVWRERFNHCLTKTHKAVETIRHLEPPLKIPDIGLTAFAQAMPDQYKNPCAVTAYRSYYNGEKRNIASWKNGKIPYWWNWWGLRTMEDVEQYLKSRPGMEQLSWGFRWTSPNKKFFVEFILSRDHTDQPKMGIWNDENNGKDWESKICPETFGEDLQALLSRLQRLM